MLRKVRNQSIVVVVSPLIALMKDQVRAMSQRINVTAVYDRCISSDIKVGKFQLVSSLAQKTLLNGD